MRGVHGKMCLSFCFFLPHMGFAKGWVSVLAFDAACCLVSRGLLSASADKP